MLTLEELEKFIEENGHLPDLPTAKEMKKEGIDLVFFSFNSFLIHYALKL